MSVPNDAAQRGEETPAAPAKTEVNDSLLQDLNSGKQRLKDLPPETRRAAMERIKQIESGEAGEPAEQPVPEPKPEETPPEVPAEAEAEDEKPKAKKLSAREARRLAQEAADDANRWEQKLAAQKARAEKAKAEFEAAQKAEVKAADDPWDADHQKKLAEDVERLKKRNEALEKWIQERDQEEIEEVTKTTTTKRDEALFGQVRMLQDEYPDQLGTTEPFQTLNAKYTAWFTKMIEASGVKEKMPNAKPEEIHAAAVARFETDEAFSKSLPALPIPQADQEKFNTLLELHHRTSKGGSYKGNFLEMLDEKGILKDVVQRGRSEAAEEAASRTVRAIKKKEDEVQPINPSEASGPGYQQGEWTAAQAQAVQQNILKRQRDGFPLTQTERDTLKRANEFFKRQFVGA